MSYNKLSELCFNDCIWDFTSRTVKAQEVYSKTFYFLFWVIQISALLRWFEEYVSSFSLGQVCFELHGEIPEDESAYFTEVPRISNYSKWKCSGSSPEIRCHSSMIKPAVSFAYCHTTIARNCWMLESYLCMCTGLKNCSTTLCLKQI